MLGSKDGVFMFLLMATRPPLLKHQQFTRMGHFRLAHAFSTKCLRSTPSSRETAELKLRTKQLYREGGTFKSFINFVIDLAFIPPMFLRVAWRGLKGNSSAFSNEKEFFQYFEDTWIESNFSIHREIFILMMAHTQRVMLKGGILS